MDHPWWVFTVWIEGQYNTWNPPPAGVPDDGWKRHIMRIQGPTAEIAMEYIRTQLGITNPGRPISFGVASQSTRRP